MSTLLATIQIRRGLAANLPGTCAPGEPLWAEDTRQLFIGDANGVPQLVSGGSAEYLSQLLDVLTASPTDGQVLTYNSVAGKWENQTPSGGGGSVPAGSNICQLPYLGNSSNGASFIGYSLVTSISASSIMNAASKCKINLWTATNYLGSTGPTVNKAVIVQYTKGPAFTTGRYVATEQITWNGGNPSPVLGGIPSGPIVPNWSDPISMAIDAQHDYDLIIYFDPASDPHSFLIAAQLQTTANVFPDQRLLSGDWTAFTTYPLETGQGIGGNYFQALSDFVTA